MNAQFEPGKSFLRRSIHLTSHNIVDRKHALVAQTSGSSQAGNSSNGCIHSCGKPCTPLHKPRRSAPILKKIAERWILKNKRELHPKDRVSLRLSLLRTVAIRNDNYGQLKDIFYR